MMNTYIITYNASKTFDYTPFYNGIKTLYPNWWHYIDNTWVVRTSDTANSIWDKLSPYLLNSNENLLIIKVDFTDKQGSLPQKAWDWLDGKS